MKAVDNFGCLLAEFCGGQHSGVYHRVNFFQVVVEESRTRGLG